MRLRPRSVTLLAALIAATFTNLVVMVPGAPLRLPECPASRDARDDGDDHRPAHDRLAVGTPPGTTAAGRPAPLRGAGAADDDESSLRRDSRGDLDRSASIFDLDDRLRRRRLCRSARCRGIRSSDQVARLREGGAHRDHSHGARTRGDRDRHRSFRRPVARRARSGAKPNCRGTLHGQRSHRRGGDRHRRSLPRRRVSVSRDAPSVRATSSCCGSAPARWWERSRA